MKKGITGSKTGRWSTGSVDTYDGWWYEGENGEKRNAVDRNEVVAVIKDKDGTWKEI